MSLRREAVISKRGQRARRYPCGTTSMSGGQSSPEGSGNGVPSSSKPSGNAYFSGCRARVLSDAGIAL